NGLTKLNLNAGNGGDIHLNVLEGAVSDGDPDIDLAGDLSLVQLLDTTKQDFGAGGSIGTSVDSLEVHTELGGGWQFISEADSASIATLNAGAGQITLKAGTFSLPRPDALGAGSTLVVNSPAIVNVVDVDDT